MRGQSRHKKRSGKLKRPMDYNSGVHGVTNPPSPAQSDVDANSNPASTFAEVDPLANVLPHELGKTYFRTKAQGEADLEDAIQEPLRNEPAIKTVLRGQLVEQAGGQANISPTMAGLLGTIVEQRVMEARINKALDKHGSLRVNHKSGKVTGQAIIKDLLLPLQGSLRLNLKQYAEECDRIRQGGRIPQGGAPLSSAGHPYMIDTESDGTLEGDMTVVNDLNIILGKPQQTAEEVIAEFKTLYEYPPPTDGSPPIPLRRG